MKDPALVITAPPVLHGVFFNSNASPRDHVVVYVVRAFSVVQPARPPTNGGSPMRA